jgi:hypothetical protein
MRPVTMVMEPQVRKLPVQVVKRLAGGLRHPAGCVLDCAHDLVSKALIRQLIVAGYSADAFFEPSCEAATRSINALL